MARVVRPRVMVAWLVQLLEAVRRGLERVLEQAAAPETGRVEMRHIHMLPAANPRADGQARQAESAAPDPRAAGRVQ